MFTLKLTRICAAAALLLLCTLSRADNGLYDRADQLAQQGDYLEAAQTYRQFLMQPGISVHREQARLKLQLIRGAIKSGAEATLGPYLNALNLRDAGEIDAAIAQCLQIVRERSTSPLADDALNFAAFMQLIDRHAHERALALYQQLLTSFPESTYADSARFGTALAYERMGRYDRAVAELIKLREKHTSIRVGVVDFVLPKDNFLSRFWFTRAENKLKTLQMLDSWDVHTGEARNRLVFAVGARFSYDMPVGSDEGYR
ncbi:MAG: tetratricopeptide repeat protein [Pseudomonadota bacterium]